MRKRRLFALPIAASLLAVATSASAQSQPGYASNHFNPSERGSRWFALDSLAIAGEGRLAIGLVNDYAYRSVADRSGGTLRSSIVRNQYFAHLGASYVVADRFRLGLSVPLQVFADGHTTAIDGVTHRPAEDPGVGDVRLALDARVFGQPKDSATIAIGSELFLPAGSPAAYTGDGKPRVLPRILFAGQRSGIAYAARLGFQYRERNESWGGGEVGSGPVAALSVGALLLEDKLLVGPELFGSTVTANGKAFEGKTTPLEAILGAHYDAGHDVRVGGGVGFGLTHGYGAPVVRGLLSIEWAPGDAAPERVVVENVDRDGDGVPDSEDACGFLPGPRSSDATRSGCPLDADRDGIPDGQDACPAVAGVASADASQNGCPADADHDGIVDGEDACPAAAGKRTTDPRTSGCPPTDRDNDGITDADDACPDQKGQSDADPKKNGCPDPDRDHDGVLNDVDACPDAAGEASTDPKRNGCPKAFLDGGRIKILDQVKFKTASAEIAVGKDSQSVLEAVLAVLKAHPEVLRIRIEGHTDDRGVAENNKALSLARASSVVAWLTAHGVDKARLVAAGFGAERPLESNTSEAGRTVNRRVEFHVEQGSER